MPHNATTSSLMGSNRRLCWPDGAHTVKHVTQIFKGIDLTQLATGDEAVDDRVLSEDDPAGYNANDQQHNPESVVAKDRNFLDRCKTRPLEADTLCAVVNRPCQTAACKEVILAGSFLPGEG